MEATAELVGLELPGQAGGGCRRQNGVICSPLGILHSTSDYLLKEQENVGFCPFKNGYICSLGVFNIDAVLA